MKKTMEVMGVGLEIIYQSTITNMLSYCDRGAILLLYQRDKDQRTEPMNIQIRGRNLNNEKEATSVVAGGFSIPGDRHLGEFVLFRDYCPKESNYRPWKIILEGRKENYKLIVAVENPRGLTMHPPGIGLD